MKNSDVAKIGLGAVGAGIIGYGLYSMKKDTEEFLKGPGNFLGGLFGPNGILGGSGLPGTETEPVNSGSSTKRFLDGLLDDLNKSLGLGQPPSAPSPKQDDVNQWTVEQQAGLSFMNLLKKSGTQVVREDLVEKFQTMPTKFNVLPTINPDKAVYTQQSLANKVAASGMPTSNLNKGTVKGTEIDKDGKERIIIKYDNGVTMRY